MKIVNDPNRKTDRQPKTNAAILCEKCDKRGGMSSTILTLYEQKNLKLSRVQDEQKQLMFLENEKLKITKKYVFF